MTRHIDALTNLNKLIAEKEHEPFQWGTWDCCIFAADIVLAMTGEDQISEFRDAYDSKYTAMVALRELGSGTLYETIRSKLGDPIPLTRARRGDIVFQKKNCGVCLGSLSAFLSEDGIILSDTKFVDAIFPIR